MKKKRSRPIAGSEPQERYQTANKKNLKVGQSKSYQKYNPPASDQIYDYLKDMKLAEEDLHELFREHYYQFDVQVS